MHRILACSSVHSLARMAHAMRARLLTACPRIPCARLLISSLACLHPPTNTLTHLPHPPTHSLSLTLVLAYSPRACLFAHHELACTAYSLAHQFTRLLAWRDPCALACSLRARVYCVLACSSVHSLARTHTLEPHNHSPFHHKHTSLVLAWLTNGVLACLPVSSPLSETRRSSLRSGCELEFILVTFVNFTLRFFKPPLVFVYVCERIRRGDKSSRGRGRASTPVHTQTLKLAYRPLIC